MGRSECVAHIQIRQISQLLGELLAVLGLLCTAETGVLQQYNIALLHCLNSFGCSLSGYIIIRNEGYFLAKLLGQSLCNGC